MLINNSEYFDVLEKIKSQIRAAQYRAVVGANRELLTLYWNIGNIILNNKSWGNKFVENLSRDNPSIGLILCRDKNKTIAEYALRDMTKPIGVSEYKLTERLPQELEKTLPSVEDIEKRVRAKYDLPE